MLALTTALFILCQATTKRIDAKGCAFDGVNLINIKSLSESNYFGVSEYIKCHRP